MFLSIHRDLGSFASNWFLTSYKADLKHMAARATDNEYACTLSEELLKQAEDELFETQETRSRCIKILRENIEKCPGKYKF